MSSPMDRRRLAAAAWESLFRAQVTVSRILHGAPIFKDVTDREYDVLFNLSRCPTGWLRLNELNAHVLLTQPSISRMVDRLEARGLVQRKTADDDRRGVQIGLTEAGVALQRKIGMAHVGNIAQLLGDALDEDELRTLLDLTTKLRTNVERTNAVARAARKAPPEN